MCSEVTEDIIRRENSEDEAAPSLEEFKIVVPDKVPTHVPIAQSAISYKIKVKDYYI